MAKLRLNYSQLKSTSENLRTHAMRLDEALVSLNKLKRTLQNQSSLTTDKFLEHLTITIDKAYNQRDFEQSVSRAIDDYVTDMQEVLAAKNEESDIILNIDDVEEKIVAIESAHNSLATGCRLDLPTSTPSQDSIELEKQQRNYEKLQSAYTLIDSYLKTAEEHVEELKRIKRDVFDKAYEIDAAYALTFAEIYDTYSQQNVVQSFFDGLEDGVRDTAKLAGALSFGTAAHIDPRLTEHDFIEDLAEYEDELFESLADSITHPRRTAQGVIDSLKYAVESPENVAYALGNSIPGAVPAIGVAGKAYKLGKLTQAGKVGTSVDIDSDLSAKISGTWKADRADYLQYRHLYDNRALFDQENGTYNPRNIPGLPSEDEILDILTEVRNGQSISHENYPLEFRIWHQKQFEKGVFKFVSDKGNSNHFPNGSNGIGHPSGTFVAALGDLPNLVEEAGGDVRTIENALGFESGYLGENPYIVISQESREVRIPMGDSAGTNERWVPGAHTSPGGYIEAEVAQIPGGTYEYFRLKDMDIGYIESLLHRKEE
ncbi:MAG: hypothetical protein IJV62_03350 [Eggerthellaceae bacterium]|nr:hypothetical protein [Eggerthellaceae bacterium]